MQEVNRYNQLSCEVARTLMSDFIDGTLDSERLVSLNAHLEMCAACTMELAAIRHTILQLRSANPPAHLLDEAKGKALRELRALPQQTAVITAPVIRNLSWTALATVTAAAALFTLWVRQETHAGNGLKINGNRVTRATPRPPALPSGEALDEMASLHTARSIGVAPGDSGVQQLALGDTDSGSTVINNEISR